MQVTNYQFSLSISLSKKYQHSQKSNTNWNENFSFHWWLIHPLRLRSSRQELFCKKGVLRNLSKFTGKHLCQSLFFNKVAGLRRATNIKKETLRRCFPVNFVKFLRTSFYTEHLWWLLLTFCNSIGENSLIIPPSFFNEDIVIRNGKIVWKHGPS